MQQSEQPRNILLTGLSRQKSAIWALVFKEYKVRLGKSRIGLFWVLLEPIVSMLMISAIWYATGRTAIHGTHVSLFIAAGFVVFLTARQGINYLPHAIDANRALLNYPQVKPIDTILARFIIGMWLHALASLLMIFGLWWVLGVAPVYTDPLLAINCILIAMLLALGFSLPLSVLGTLNPNILKFITLVTQPLMILSGVMYSTYELPTTARLVLQWNPIVHLVAGFRHGLFGSKVFPEYTLFYPFMFGLISLGLGYALYYLYRFKLIQQ